MLHQAPSKANTAQYSTTREQHPATSMFLFPICIHLSRFVRGCSALFPLALQRRLSCSFVGQVWNSIGARQVKKVLVAIHKTCSQARNCLSYLKTSSLSLSFIDARRSYNNTGITHWSSTKNTLLRGGEQHSDIKCKPVVCFLFTVWGSFRDVWRMPTIVAELSTCLLKIDLIYTTYSATSLHKSTSINITSSFFSGISTSFQNTRKTILLTEKEEENSEGKLETNS